MTDSQIAFGWNAYQSCQSKSCSNASIVEQGVMSWVDPNIVISIFFYIATAGVFDISVVCDSIMKSTYMQISIPTLHKTFTKQFTPGTLTVNIGQIKAYAPGYIRVNFKSYNSNSFLTQATGNFPALKYLVLSGNFNQNSLTYVQESFSSHYGRRGPSVHLWYQYKSTGQIAQFYNEVTVPKNKDIIGTYAMAIGFDGGYFGMQVNSPTERRILFSVWSPQNTDDPNSVTSDNAVILDSKGTNTTINQFGGEGSGGQSYLIYPWVAGVAYQFTLYGKPIDNGYSQFTAYFKDPSQEEQILIASWKRPKTQSYLNGIYSFLENFSPENGQYQRIAYYKNQKAYDSNGNFVNVDSASFSYDSTADSKQRFDYDGGLAGKKGIYLRHCGFFNKTSVQYGDVFKISGSN